MSGARVAAWILVLVGAACSPFHDEAAQSNGRGRSTRQTAAQRGTRSDRVSRDTVALKSASSPSRWSEAWLLAQGTRYLEDRSFRRAAMLESLRNPENLYSRQRIAFYGLGNRGWDALPAWNPRSRQVRRGDFAGPEKGAPRQASETAPLWDGRRPESMADWIALGRKVFHRYPLRSDPFVEHALARPSRAERLGVQRTSDGRYPGVVSFRDVEGKTRVGITCALCHTAVVRGTLVEGRARRSLDYGRIRLQYHHETKAPTDPELARRMALWGPGRADITEDEAEDPVAIPDLWGLRHQSDLTQAGTLRHTGPVALALRQETQLLHSNHQRVRPPRALAWALAMFLYSLEPPPLLGERGSSTDDHVAARGAAIFDARCSSCHSNAVKGGGVVALSDVGTDPGLAMGVARGTGAYRPPALVRVADAAPYFHDGAVASLEDLLSRRRLRQDYRGPSGRRGAVVGHQVGLDLAPSDKRALLRYLRSL